MKKILIVVFILMSCHTPNIPPDPLCEGGVNREESDLIADGKETNGFPEVFKLYCGFDSCDSCKKIFCTATLISPKTILTAKHCVVCDDPNDIYIKRGSIKTYIKKIIKHPTKDLAIGILVKELDTKPAVLSNIRPRSGDNILILGFGDSNNNIPSDKLGYGCNKINLVYSREIEYKHTGGSSGCFGDSGGPTYANRELIAVHSECLGCGECGNGTSFDVRIDKNLKWIKSNSF